MCVMNVHIIRAYEVAIKASTSCGRLIKPNFRRKFDLST
uniref:Uncharacterized protein n=1 Tax=Arundo donax TaxID=35708 RepID=A0A0A8Y417_ARUDO